MVSRKEASSKTSSEEYDPQEQVKEEATTTITAPPITAASTRRSYECTFCKRGFTNAQALGGHMNIHRKDRAKAKQVTGNSSISSAKPNEEYMNPNYMGPISSEPMNYYPILEAQRNSSVYFQPSGPSSPRQRPQHQLPHGNYCYSGIQRHQSLCMNEELWGANLSLQIGSNHVDDNIELNVDVSKEDELDLELRLGHDRY